MELYNCINFQLSLAQQVVSQTFKDYLAEFDVTPAQYAVLKVLWTQNGRSPSDIAELISVDRPAITGVLDRLESKELIYRSPDLHDRRAIKVFLTDKAIGLEEKINVVIEAAHLHALRDFSAAEKEQMLSYLRRISSS